MKFIRRLHFAVFAVASCVAPGALHAATVNNQTYTGAFPAVISGTLANQGTALEESITLTAASGLTLFSTSYATGGFEPNLVLFNSAGQFVAGSGTPGTSPVASRDPATGKSFDAYLSLSDLMAGSYTIALTDWELNQSPTATNLSDGFTANYGDGINFIDQTGASRTGSYSLTAELSSSTMTSTPEPSSLLLVAPFFLFAGLYARKRAPFSNR